MALTKYISDDRKAAEDDFREKSETLAKAIKARDEAYEDMKWSSYEAYKAGMPVLRMSKISKCSRQSHINWIKAKITDEEREEARTKHPVLTRGGREHEESPE